jgi:L-seryl-tRNA(Ser) seleniumtransferase
VHPPSVDALARALSDIELPHPLLVDCARRAIASGPIDNVADRARRDAEQLALSMLQPVINATGVLLHTNLGRAPVHHVASAAASNVELDLATGARGSRHAHAAALLARAAGAEAAVVVNNGAAAVLLVLAALAEGRGVLVSRGESVEIGGGFRVPEVMAQSGARLIDVGTTNRTRLSDFAAALDAARPNAAGALTPDVALVLKVHTSNYRIEGFTESVPVAQLATLGVAVVVDIGSGLLDAQCPWLRHAPPPWLSQEMAARQTLEAGAALVTFSGDKLLGGPQAGIIAGRADLVTACARHPLARALRPGALVLSALQETALAYLRRDGDAIAFWRMATVPAGELEARARRVATAAGVGEVVATQALPGAGSVPGSTIDSFGLALDGDHLDHLRRHRPPVIARVRDQRTIIDLRAVDAADDAVILAALQALQALRLPRNH